MARKRLVVNKWNGGISNDEYVGQAGACYDCENLEIRKNSRAFYLGQRVSSARWTGSSKIVALYGEDEDDIQSFSQNGTVNSFAYSSSGIGDLYDIRVSSSGNATIRNVSPFTISGTDYFLILCGNRIHRTTVNASGIPLYLGSSLLIGAGWSGTNWTFSGTNPQIATHTPGFTNVLTNGPAIPAVASTYYRVQLKISGRTAGSVTVNFGGATSAALSANQTHTVWLFTSSTANFEIAPTSDFDGAIDIFQTSSSLDLVYVQASSVTEEYKTFTYNATYRPVLNWFGVLLIGNGEWVATLDATGVLTENLVSVKGEVRAITNVGDQVVIWTNDWGMGRQYFWDGVSDSISRVIDWKDLPIVNVVNQGSYHVVTCFKSVYQPCFVYVSDGYSRNLVYKSAIPPDSRIKLISENTNSVDSYGNIVLLPGDDKIYGYGDYYPGFPKSLSKDFTLPADPTTIYSPYYASGTEAQIWAASGESPASAYKIEMRENQANYAASGYLTMNPLLGEMEGTAKAALKVRVGFRLPNAATAINVYYQLDDSGSFTLLKAIGTTEYGTGYNRALFNFNSDFYKAQFKIELTTSSATYTPYVFDFAFVYDEIENDF